MSKIVSLVIDFIVQSSPMKQKILKILWRSKSMSMPTAWRRGLKRPTTVLSLSRDLDSTPTLGAHVVASLDKVLYDDYLCLVASNKQQIQW